jgi:DNA-binding transcriptional LysR family regulator
MDEARRALEDRMGLVRGDLWMAASTIPGHYILPRLMADFRKQYPDVRLHMEVGNSEWVVERVRRHDVELGFVGARWERPGLSFQPVAEDELILVVPRGHPLSGGEAIDLSCLPSLPFVSRIRGSGTRTSWEDLLVRAGIDPEGLNIVAELGTTEAILRGIRAGLGVGVVSIWAVEEELRNGDMERVPLKGLRLARTFHAVHSIRQNLSPAARQFLSLAPRIGEDAGVGHGTSGSAPGGLDRSARESARER